MHGNETRACALGLVGMRPATASLTRGARRGRRRRDHLNGVRRRGDQRVLTVVTISI